MTRRVYRYVPEHKLLRTCPDCGCVIYWESMALHDQWHDRERTALPPVYGGSTPAVPPEDSSTHKKFYSTEGE